MQYDAAAVEKGGIQRSKIKSLSKPREHSSVGWVKLLMTHLKIVIASGRVRVFGCGKNKRGSKPCFKGFFNAFILSWAGYERDPLSQSIIKYTQ